MRQREGTKNPPFFEPSLPSYALASGPTKVGPWNLQERGVFLFFFFFYEFKLSPFNALFFCLDKRTGFRLSNVDLSIVLISIRISR